MKTKKNVLSVIVILAFGMVAGIVLRGLYFSEAQARVQAPSRALTKSTRGSYAAVPIMGHCCSNEANSTEGVLAISPAGDVYVIRVDFDSNKISKAKVVQHFNLEDSKAGKKW